MVQVCMILRKGMNRMRVSSGTVKLTTESVSSPPAKVSPNSSPSRMRTSMVLFPQRSSFTMSTAPERMMPM